jgi:hypothetical protein
MRDIYTSEAERHLSFLNHLQEIVIAINSEGDIVFNNAPEKAGFIPTRSPVYTPNLMFVYWITS